MFVRWDNLAITAEKATQLPGYREPAVIRHFDAPEALDVRFYEVRAKSTLNRVPKKSRMPFRWTINPYRGCTHACRYCLHGDTPVLMGDGSTKRLADVQIGDVIYGTVRDGRYRRYVRTRVEEHWSSIKPAYRVTLADGTELITSADHRFLSERGWKHVTGSGAGRGQRPHLTTGNTLRGTGRFAPGPAKNRDYRVGYLSGMIRGDGHLQFSQDPPDRVRVMRLALIDDEALDRCERYLEAEGITTRRFLFQAATSRSRAVNAIRAGVRGEVERLQPLIRWPLSPTDEWRKGFLAGIFDAEGSAGGMNALRIANTDPIILRWTQECLRHFGFAVRVDDRRLTNGLQYVRFVGGLKERLRFLHLTDPAIMRKRNIEGLALKSDADLRVVSVEPLALSMRMFDITTGTSDFIANGVVSHNCFARPTHTYLGFDAGRDFEREIVVKVNAPELLRLELARPSWQGEHVAMGTNTDPYQWVESRYRLMPGIWEALRDFANPCSVLTKSPLVLRDLDLLVEVAAVTEVSANLSVPTIDERAWRASEPHTPHPRKRLEAVAELNRAGIPTGVLVAPLMPGINDDPRQVEAILEAATNAGATGVGGIALHLRGEVKGVFMEWLRSYRPDLVPRYEELYRRGAYAPAQERERIAAMLRSRRPAPFARERRGLRSTDRTVADPAGRAPPSGPPEADRPRRGQAQQSLF